MINFSCGHPATPENTYSYPERHRPDGYTRSPQKVCKTCILERARSHYKPSTTRKKDRESRIIKPCLLAEVWK